MYIVNLCEPVEALKCLLALRSRPGNVERQPVSNVFMCFPFDVLVRFCLSKFDSHFGWQIINIQILGHDLYIRGPGVPHANWSSIMHVQVLPTSLLQQSDFSLFFLHVGAWQEIVCTATWKVAKLVSSVNSSRAKGSPAEVHHTVPTWPKMSQHSPMWPKIMPI